MLLKGKTALVTGASRGIGKAIALVFAKEGCDVAINCIKNKDKLMKVSESIKSMGQNTIVFLADVSNWIQVKNMIQKILKTWGRIDILVNNAGITRDVTLHKMEPEQWKMVIDVNLSGVFNCTRAVLNKMREQKSGKIINISSIVGEIGNFGQTNYAASKSGVIGFTKALAIEVASKGITVNAIAPGFIETDMLKVVPEEIKKKMLDKIPLGRFGKPEEIAQAAVYLASDATSFITGQVLNINGGQFI